MEEFGALDVGTEVVVKSRTLGDQRWTKVAEGWSHNGSVIRPEHFVGAVTAGKVLLATEEPLRPGDWIESGMYQHYVVANGLLPSGNLRTVRFRRGLYHSVTDVAPGVLTNATDATVQRMAPPEWAERVTGLAQTVTDLMRENDRLRALPTLGVGQVAVNEGLVSRLQQYADDAGDVGLDEILDDNGVGREREHASRIYLSGTATSTMSYDEAGDYLNDSDVEIDDIEDGSLIRWSKTVYESRTGRGCTCEEWDRNELSSYLPDNVDSWDFEATCDD